jgi:hypothetical protein
VATPGSLIIFTESHFGAEGNRPKISRSIGRLRESVFSAFDEDYHISRFFHFQCAAGAGYKINGFPQSHVSIDADIQAIL